jgi:class I fructose-bisphosphate aldolase
MRPYDDSPIQRDGRTIILAHDHGLEHGPSAFSATPDRLDPEHVFEMATHDAVTALAVQKGPAETFYPSYEDDVNLLAKVNGTSNLWMGEHDSAVNWSVDYAAELGADAIGFTIYGGSNHEIEMVEEFREVQERARQHNLPVAVWAYPRGMGIKNDRSKDTIAYAAREAMEIGADIAKVKYPGSGEAMAWAVQAAGPTDVVLSGGPKVSDEEFLELVETVLEAGCTGLAVGRNIWQREDPEPFLDALEAVVFEEATVEEALD